MIGNFIAGLIAITLLVGFLGYLAYDINALPLWVGIIAGLLLAIADFLESVRTGPEKSGP